MSSGVVYFIGADKQDAFYVAIPRQELRGATIETELRSVKVVYRTIHLHAPATILVGEVKAPAYARREVGMSEADAKAVLALVAIARAMFDDLVSGVDTDVTWSVTTDGEWSRKETRPA